MCFFVSSSQDKGELHLNIGLNYPKIGFVDSDGNQSLLSDFNNISSNHLKLGYKRNVSKDVGILASVISNRFDVLGRYETSSNNYNYVKYNLDYLTASLALTLDIALPDDLCFVPNIGLNYNYLMSGFQSFSASLFNLKEDKDFVPYSISVNPGFYFSKKVSPFINFQLGYNYVFDIETDERTTAQTYELESYTFFVGAALKIGALKTEDNKQQIVGNKLVEIENSLLNINQEVKDATRYVDSVFVDGTSWNTLLESEIEKYILIQNQIKENLVSDFIVLFPSNKSQYYDLFDDTMLEVLAVAKSQSDLKIKIVGYADLNGKDKSNLILSKNRTETIKKYLIDNGIDPKKITVEFLGETSMFDSKVLMSNRRVEIFISKQ